MHRSGTQGRNSRPASVEDLQARLYNRALDLLARREHSRRELQQKLVQRATADGGTADLVQVILDKLRDQGLQSDERFAEAYINMRARKGFGPARIVRELVEKGIETELASSFIHERTDWGQLMEQAWRKKFSHPPVDHADKARQIRFLLYRGYDMEAIHAFLGPK